MATLLVLLLASGSANGLWNQWGGDGGASGQGLGSSAPLDVVEHLALGSPLGFGQSTEPAQIVATGPDSLAAAFADNDPRILRIFPGNGTTSAWVHPDANGGIDLFGYDAASDGLLISYLANTNTIQESLAAHIIELRSATDYTLIWKAPVALTQGGITTYTASSALLPEQRMAIIAIGAAYTGISELRALDLDSGEQLWRESIPVPVPFDSPPEFAGSSVPIRITASAAGISVNTIRHPQGPPGLEDDWAGLHRYSLDGTHQGVIDPFSPLVGSEPEDLGFGLAGASVAASGTDEQHVFATGNLVFFMHPETGRGQTRDLGSAVLTGSDCIFWHAPVWTKDQAIVFGSNSAAVFSASNTWEWTPWTVAGGSTIESAWTTLDGDIFLIVSPDPEDGRAHSIMRVDSGLRVLQQMPLTGQTTFECTKRVVPMPDIGMVVVAGRDGQLTFLSENPTSPRPSVQLSKAYPQPGENVTISIAAPKGTQLSVGLGDGTILSGEAPLRIEHRYAEARAYRIYATAIHRETTSTGYLEIHVGGSAPLELSWIQQRFAPGNQDMTWGVIGIILVLIGAGATWASSRLGRRRIATGLRDLATIRRHATTEPLAALGMLQNWHHSQEDRLLRGRLTEDQFRVLENRGARVVRGISRNLMDPMNLSPSFARKLDAAMVDGFVDPAEVDGLRRAAKKEKLANAHRATLFHVFDAWSNGRPLR